MRLLFFFFFVAGSTCIRAGLECVAQFGLFRLTHAAPIKSQRYIYFIIRNENYSAAKSTSCDFDRSVHVRITLRLVAFAKFIFIFFHIFFFAAHFLKNVVIHVWRLPIVIGDLAFTARECECECVCKLSELFSFIMYYIGGHIVCKTPCTASGYLLWLLWIATRSAGVRCFV